jgi:hypothetical protein
MILTVRWTVSRMGAQSALIAQSGYVFLEAFIVPRWHILQRRPR